MKRWSEIWRRSFCSVDSACALYLCFQKVWCTFTRGSDRRTVWRSSEKISRLALYTGVFTCTLHWGISPEYPESTQPGHPSVNRPVHRILALISTTVHWFTDSAMKKTDSTVFSSVDCWAISIDLRLKSCCDITSENIILYKINQIMTVKTLTMIICLYCTSSCAQHSTNISDIIDCTCKLYGVWFWYNLCLRVFLFWWLAVPSVCAVGGFRFFLWF